MSSSLGHWKAGGNSHEAESPPITFFSVWFQLLVVASDSVLLHMPSAVSEKKIKRHRERKTLRHKKSVVLIHFHSSLYCPHHLLEITSNVTLTIPSTGQSLDICHLVLVTGPAWTWSPPFSQQKGSACPVECV